MKKLLLLSLVAFGTLFISNKTQAQSNWEAGIRTNFDNVALDVTIPFKAPRIHAAAYFGGGGVGLGGYFDWMFSLNGGPTGLKFYPGVGPELYFGDGFFEMGVAGDFGAEYSFDFPLTIGFDWRPGFLITENFNFYSGNWGFIARFRIGEGVSFSKSN